jgi:hypothetical protein
MINDKKHEGTRGRLERTEANRRLSGVELRERAEANRRLSEVEHAPLTARKEAAASFFEAMRDGPRLVAQRIEWLLGGDYYGCGARQLAKRVLHSPRMNRSAALTHMIAAFEWCTPNAMARATWTKLTKGQQAVLEKAVLATIRSAEHEEAREAREARAK